MEYACIHGNLNVAKLILGLFPNLNLSYDGEKYLSDACFYGHIEIVKWLY